MISSKNIFRISLFTVYILFLAASSFLSFDFGIRASENLIHFFKEMILILPAAFILIGLFESWISREMVEKHLGEESGFLSYIWVTALAGTMVGGLYLAFPVAASLRKKNARLSVIFVFLFASAIYRIPMTIFEASFLGLKFTLIRVVFAFPLMIGMSLILERISVLFKIDLNQLKKTSFNGKDVSEMPE